MGMIDELLRYKKPTEKSPIASDEIKKLMKFHGITGMEVKGSFGYFTDKQGKKVKIALPNSGNY
jgi:hypothetical protein